MTDEKKPVSGRAKGGAVVAAKMTAEQKTDRATKGALARWGLKATHKGNFKKELGVDAECYVLNDPGKTAVITQLGMGEILGLGSGGSRLPRFVFNKTMSEYLGPELAEKIRNPVIFHIVSAGQGGASLVKANGYDATILIDICRAVLQAKSDGRVINPAVVAQAGIIVGASAKAGIQGLVYALAGYRPEAEEVISAFKAFVQAEAKKYASEFPPELYLEWARLYGHKPQRSWKDMHLTINHVYYPLAKSDGQLLALLREAKSSSGDRNAKLFQFLNIVGARALRFQLGRVFDVAESSSTSEEYEAKIAQRFGGQQMLKFSGE